jgi:Protein of unknown function (DUF4236)
MGFRFRKSVKLLPGVRLNFSKSGVSTTIGRPGASINVGGTHGPRANVGIPGTGISYSEHLDASAQRESEGPEAQRQGMGLWRLLAWGVVALFVLLMVRAAFG